MLAQMLQEHGVRCDVLSRGYGRTSAAVERVDPGGDARRFGDEPMELARAGLEVWVGADRYRAGLAAEAAAEQPDGSMRVHLLDDGFQHRRLGRRLDVVLLTAEDVRDSLLPTGNLREPLRALARADVVVVREEEAQALAPHTQGREVWVVRRTVVLPDSTPRRPIVFCGLARPEGFFAGLAAAGCQEAGRIAFPDHHPYRWKDIERLAAAAQQNGADGFLTTAKDAVKLTDRMRARLGHLAIAELRVQAANPDAVWARMRQALESGPA